MSTEQNPADDPKLTPSEPSAHDYEPGAEELDEGSQTRDPAEGGDDVPPEAHPA